MKKIILILTVIFLIGCSGTDPNDVTTGGGSGGGGGNCTGTEAGHPNNPGCVVIPPVVTPPAGTAGLTWSKAELPLTPADWTSTKFFDDKVVVPNHSDPISLLALPKEIASGRGTLGFNIVGNTDNLYLVTETTQNAGLAFDLLFVKKDKVEGKYYGITVKADDMSYTQPLYQDVTLTGQVYGGPPRVWRVNNPLSDGALAAAASLGNDDEYHIYMIITKYLEGEYSNKLIGKNVIKIK